MIETILILIAAVAAGISGIIISKNLYGNNMIHGKIKIRYDSYILELEKSNKKLTGQLNRLKQAPSISDNDYDSDNPLAAVGTIIQQFSPMLPKSIQPLLNDPKLMDFVGEQLKNNPEAVKGLIEKFVKKGKSKTDETIPDHESMSV